MRRRAATAVLVAGLVLAGAGCASSSDDSGSDGGSGGGGGSSATEVQAAPGGDEGGGGGGASEGGEAVAEEVAAGAGDLGAQDPPETEAERIVYTSEVRVRVDDPSAAAEEAVALVEEAGGSLASQDEREGEETVTVTVRVPVAGFTSALDAVKGLGEVLDTHVAAEEVTDQIVDLQGRLENARASADRLRELYATAPGVEQIVAIEQALTQREAEVESLAGQLQQLEDRADRSTITATFVAEGEPVAAAEDEVDRSGFGGGLRTGWDVVVALARAASTVAGFLVPFLPPLLLVGLVLLVLRRRTRRSRRAPGSPGDEEAAPATE